MLNSYAAWKQICFDISSLIKRNKLSLRRFIRRTVLSSLLSSNKKTPLTKYFDLDAALRTNGGREWSTLSFSYSQVDDMCHSHQKWIKILVMKWESKCMSVFSLFQYGDTMTNIVVVQFSDYVQTGRDKRYNLTCLFRGPGEAVVTSSYMTAK